MDLISVIVPIHNTEPYLHQCIDSIRNQTWTNWELLLINDASVDRCGEICKAYVSQQPDRIRYFEVSFGSAADSRNLGIEKAAGEYLYFADSDDWCEADLLEKAHEQACKWQADLVSFGYQEHRGKKRKVYQYKKNGRITKEECFRSLLTNDEIGNYSCNKLFRRELFAAIRFPSGEVFEDLSIFYQLVLKSRCIAVWKEPLYHYRRRNDSVSACLGEKEVMELYRAVRARKTVLFMYDPGLQELLLGNQIQYDIFIWNQIGKKFGKKKQKSYRFLLEEIARNKRVIRRFPLRERVMGDLICLVPGLYAEALYWFGKLRKKKHV